MYRGIWRLYIRVCMCACIYARGKPTENFIRTGLERNLPGIILRAHVAADYGRSSLKRDANVDLAITGPLTSVRSNYYPMAPIDPKISSIVSRPFRAEFEESRILRVELKEKVRIDIALENADENIKILIHVYISTIFDSFVNEISIATIRFLEWPRLSGVVLL